MAQRPSHEAALLSSQPPRHKRWTISSATSNPCCVVRGLSPPHACLFVFPRRAPGPLTRSRFSSRKPHEKHTRTSTDFNHPSQLKTVEKALEKLFPEPVPEDMPIALAARQQRLSYLYFRLGIVTLVRDDLLPRLRTIVDSDPSETLCSPTHVGDLFFQCLLMSCDNAGLLTTSSAGARHSTRTKVGGTAPDQGAAASEDDVYRLSVELVSFSLDAISFAHSLATGVRCMFSLRRSAVEGMGYVLRQIATLHLELQRRVFVALQSLPMQRFARVACDANDTMLTIAIIEIVYKLHSMVAHGRKRGWSARFSALPEKLLLAVCGGNKELLQECDLFGGHTVKQATFASACFQIAHSVQAAASKTMLDTEGRVLNSVVSLSCYGEATMTVQGTVHAIPKGIVFADFSARECVLFSGDMHSSVTMALDHFESLRLTPVSESQDGRSHPGDNGRGVDCRLSLELCLLSLTPAEPSQQFDSEPPSQRSEGVVASLHRRIEFAKIARVFDRNKAPFPDVLRSPGSQLASDRNVGNVQVRFDLLVRLGSLQAVREVSHVLDRRLELERPQQWSQQSGHTSASGSVMHTPRKVSVTSESLWVPARGGAGCWTSQPQHWHGAKLSAYIARRRCRGRGKPRRVDRVSALLSDVSAAGALDVEPRAQGHGGAQLPRRRRLAVLPGRLLSSFPQHRLRGHPRGPPFGQGDSSQCPSFGAPGDGSCWPRTVHEGSTFPRSTRPSSRGATPDGGPRSSSPSGRFWN